MIQSDTRAPDGAADNARTTTRDVGSVAALARAFVGVPTRRRLLAGVGRVARAAHAARAGARPRRRALSACDRARRASSATSTATASSTCRTPSRRRPSPRRQHLRDRHVARRPARRLDQLARPQLLVGAGAAQPDARPHRPGLWRRRPRRPPLPPAGHRLQGRHPSQPRHAVPEPFRRALGELRRVRGRARRRPAPARRRRRRRAGSARVLAAAQTAAVGTAVYFEVVLPGRPGRAPDSNVSSGTPLTEYANPPRSTAPRRRWRWRPRRRARARAALGARARDRRLARLPCAPRPVRVRRGAPVPRGSPSR